MSAPEALPPFDTYRATRQFGALNGLRFVCIAMVIWHHVPNKGALVDLGAFVTRGFLGVDFFFVLSGYLITTLLLREEDTHGRFDLVHFYWRRLLRIVPVYFFVVSLMAVYFIGIEGRTALWEVLPYYYLFLSNFLIDHIPNLTITWSLSMEEQYYLVWPALLLLVPRRLIVPLLLGLIALNIVAVLGVLGVTAPTWGPLRFTLPAATYAPILMGALVAIMLHQRAGFMALFPVLGSKFAPLLAFLGLGLAIALAPSDVRGLPNLVIHTLMCAALASLVMREDTFLHPVLALPWIARIGEISYGMYLYHLIMLTVVFKAVGALGLSLPPPGLLFVLYFAMTVAVAELSFRTLERWFLGQRNLLRPQHMRSSAHVRDTQ